MMWFSKTFSFFIVDFITRNLKSYEANLLILVANVKNKVRYVSVLVGINKRSVRRLLVLKL